MPENHNNGVPHPRRRMNLSSAVEAQIVPVQVSAPLALPEPIQRPRVTAFDVWAAAGKPLLTIRECALLTGYSSSKLKTVFDAGKLKGHRDGRIRRVARTDLDEWIKTL